MIDLHRESSGFGIERVAIRGWGPGCAVGFAQGEIAERRHLAEQDQRVAVVEIHRRQLAPLVREPLACAAFHARHVRAFPRSRIEHEAAAPRLRRAPQPEQRIAQQIARGSRPGVDEAPFVLPLRHGLA